MGERGESLGLLGAVAIGVGGMVGGGIFAVLGLSVELSRGGAPLAFGLAGVVALVTSYSYARLSVALPSQGGTVTFLDSAFGAGLLTGSLNILLWISYIVMLSLYAYAFGSYAAALLPDGSPGVYKHLFISVAVVGITGLNFASAALIGKAEEWIVIAKLLILVFFIVVGAWSIDTARLDTASWAPGGQILAGGMIIFLAYEGFELIANSADDIRDPSRTLPRAYFVAVGFVLVIYVLISAVTVGNLSVDAIVTEKDYALAAAARPFLGQAGYVLISIAALLSTASAINATLYGSARLSYIIAKDGELPEVLEHKVWKRPAEGLLITAAITLLMANLFDLSSISTMGSGGFLIVFAAVNMANVVLARQTNSRRWLSGLGTLLCLAALGSLVWHTAKTAPSQLWLLAGMAGLAVAIEATYRAVAKRGGSS